MRIALALTLLAACGGGSSTFSIDPVPGACPTCGPGRIRAAARTEPKVTFAADGARLVAFGDQHIEWLGPDLAPLGAGDTSMAGRGYVLGPFVNQVLTAADGHGFAQVGGANRDGGSSLSLIGLDGGGHQSWSLLVDDDTAIPAAWPGLTPDGDLLFVADTSAGATVFLGTGGMIYQGWVLVAKLGAADGVMKSVKLISATRTRISAAAATGDGGVVIAGQLDGVIKLGGAVGDVTSPAVGRTTFVARLGPDGNGVWVKTWTGGAAGYVSAIAVDGDRLFVEGTLNTSLDLGDAMLTPPDGTTSGFVVALGGDGKYQWSSVLSNGFGFLTIAPSPRGLLLGGQYAAAVTIGDAVVPAPAAAGALCAELVDGHLAWSLPALGNGLHRCLAVGTVGGRGFLSIDAYDPGDGSAVDTTIDGLTVADSMRLIAEVGTAP